MKENLKKSKTNLISVTINDILNEPELRLNWQDLSCCVSVAVMWCEMLKRLFLATTITFPLYLLVYIDGSMTTSSLLQPRLTEKASQVASKLKEDITEIHQELFGLKNTSTEAKNWLIK